VGSAGRGAQASWAWLGCACKCGCAWIRCWDWDIPGGLAMGCVWVEGVWKVADGDGECERKVEEGVWNWEEGYDGGSLCWV
jgi:hypothetical protein